MAADGRSRGFYLVGGNRAIFVAPRFADAGQLNTAASDKDAPIGVRDRLPGVFLSWLELHQPTPPGFLKFPSVGTVRFAFRDFVRCRSWLNDARQQNRGREEQQIKAAGGIRLKPHSAISNQPLNAARKFNSRPCRAGTRYWAWSFSICPKAVPSPPRAARR